MTENELKLIRQLAELTNTIDDLKSENEALRHRNAELEKQKSDAISKIYEITEQPQSMTHIEKAIASYYSATHPDISWGLQESGLSVAHAVTYDLKSWCGEDGFQYVLANVKQSGLTYCSRCIKALEEAGIDSEGV